MNFFLRRQHLYVGGISPHSLDIHGVGKRWGVAWSIGPKSAKRFSEDPMLKPDESILFKPEALVALLRPLRQQRQR